MFKDLVSRFWSGSSLGGGLPFFGPDMTNRSTIASKNPENLASVQRSVQILSDSLCSTSINVMRSLPTGGYESITDSELAKAFKRLRYRDLDLAISNALIGGNGFLQIHRDPSGKISFEAIAAHRVSLAIDGSGGHWYKVTEDLNLNQPELILSPADMVHIRYKISKENPLMGVSPLRQIHESLPAIVDAFSLMGTLSRNLSAPGLILSSDLVMTKEQVNRLREVADSQANGYKAGSTMILTSGLKPVASQISDSIKDQDLINALKFSTTEVSRVYGVPPSLLGSTETTSFASATELHRSFQRSTIKPLMARVADAFQEALLSDSDIDAGLEICFDSADFGVGKELSETLSSLVNSGIYTTNEARNLLGQADIIGGDIARCPANTMPADSWQTYFETSQPQTTPGQ